MFAYQYRKKINILCVPKTYIFLWFDGWFWYFRFQVCKFCVVLQELRFIYQIQKGTQNSSWLTSQSVLFSHRKCIKSLPYGSIFTIRVFRTWWYKQKSLSGYSSILFPFFLSPSLLLCLTCSLYTCFIRHH